MEGRSFWDNTSLTSWKDAGPTYRTRVRSKSRDGARVREPTSKKANEFRSGTSDVSATVGSPCAQEAVSRHALADRRATPEGTHVLSSEEVERAAVLGGPSLGHEVEDVGDAAALQLVVVAQQVVRLLVDGSGHGDTARRCAVGCTVCVDRRCTHRSDSSMPVTAVSSDRNCSLRTRDHATV
jgi:hypothetical protein